MSSEKKTIFLVDDNATNLKVGKNALAEHYNVLTLNSGERLLKTLERMTPDLILLDIEMPEMDGYETIKILKGNEKTAQIPVIFLTAKIDGKSELEGLELGAADYITKPFTPAVVELRVRKQLQILSQLRTIKHLSMTDQLTGLPNRRSIDNRLNSEWNRAAREQTAISILLIDVDKFKDYNDTHGHQQGDVALQCVGKILRQSIKRPADFAARWGGEEFMILLPNTDRQGALIVAEDIRKNMEETSVPCSDGLAAKITISIGVAAVNSEERCKTIDEFVFRADTALYTAKTSGRNRVCCFED